MTQGTLGFAGAAGKCKKRDSAVKDPIALFKLLLQGRYIMRRNSHDKKYEYCLYEGKAVPVKFIKTATFKELEKFELLRRKKDAWIVSRSTARKFHGNSRYKKAYNKSK